jgi:hypothetical protein
MVKKNVELPPVLGDSLAAGLARASGKEKFNQFQSRADNDPMPFSGKKSRSSIFRWHVKHVERLFGEGWIKSKISGEGKNQKAHIYGVVPGENGAMCFSEVCIKARHVMSFESHMKNRAFASPHAVQRLIQCFHTNELKVLGRLFHDHVEQVLQTSSSSSVLYTMTKHGLAVWAPQVYEDDAISSLGIEAGESVWLCKTFIPTDSLGGQHAIRRQRWLEGLDFQ